MNRRDNVRSNMVNCAVRLLATEGVEGTSFREVLAAASAPRGSVYHHFPGGKSELLHAALDRVSDRALAAMEEARGKSATEVLETFLGLWRQLLERSDFEAGCAVVAVTVAGPSEDQLDHVGATFRTWTALLAELFVAGGLSPEVAPRMATMSIAGVEGAVILARAERSMQPLDKVSTVLMELIRASM